MPTEENRLARVARRLVESKGAVAFTGAGVSVESGIPDFRSAGGLWDKFDPMEYASIDSFKRNPEKVWEMLREMDEMVTGAEPNPAHKGLARLEELGVLDGVITQNIDNLHQRGGSKVVVEFHGNGERLLCLECGATDSATEARARWKDEFPPRCSECGSILKPDVVFFGEPIPPQASAEAMRLAQKAPVLLSIGTSVLVAPASYIPVVAKKAGALIVEINREHTVLTDELVDEPLRGRAGRLVPLLVEAVERELSDSQDS